VNNMTDRIYYSREAEERALRERTAVVVLMMLLGLSAGAVLALLFAPQSGERTRKVLGESLESVREQVEERLRSA
jgi:uncharacterized membrane protein affecting hemolysin expression